MGRHEAGACRCDLRFVVEGFNPDGSVADDGLRLVVEQAKSEAKITRDISLSEVSDLSGLREAQTELGIRAQ